MDERLHGFAAAILDCNMPVPAGLVGPDGRPSPRRFAVYRNNVVVGLIDTLMAAYPAVCKIVGTEFFRAMAGVFAVQSPPVSPIMHDYGDGFASFIEAFSPAKSVPYLADVARIERAWVQSYHAAEAAALTPDQLGVIPPERFGDVVLRLHPSLQLVRSAFPAVTIWQMNTASGTPAPVDLSVAEDALIIRPYAEVEVRVLPVGALEFISASRRGRSTADAAKQALAANVRFDLAPAIGGLITIGAVVGWRLGDQTEFAVQRGTDGQLDH
jgi:hypothetical protein